MCGSYSSRALMRHELHAGMPHMSALVLFFFLLVLRLLSVSNQQSANIFLNFSAKAG